MDFKLGCGHNIHKIIFQGATVMSVKDRIKQVRQTLGFTQSKFAERIAISTSYLAGMEIGDNQVNKRTIRMISMEFDVSEHWLLTGEGSMYDEVGKANIAKITSLFKLLTASYQECAISQLNMLVDLQNTNQNSSG